MLRSAVLWDPSMMINGATRPVKKTDHRGPNCASSGQNICATELLFANFIDYYMFIVF